MHVHVCGVNGRRILVCVAGTTNISEIIAFVSPSHRRTGALCCGRAGSQGRQGCAYNTRSPRAKQASWHQKANSPPTDSTTVSSPSAPNRLSMVEMDPPETYLPRAMRYYSRSGDRQRLRVQFSECSRESAVAHSHPQNTWLMLTRNPTHPFPSPYALEQDEESAVAALGANVAHDVGVVKVCRWA